MQIITAAIIKGGTGKTSSCAALAQAAANAGKRVLAIDLDPSANFSLAIGADQTQSGVFEVLEMGVPAADVVQQTPQGIYAITASPRLATVKTTPASAKRLKTALEPLKDKFDVCIIDTPPTLDEMVFTALQTATGLLVPLEADTNSLQGLYQIADIAEQMRRSNPELKVLGSVLTRFDGRPNINRYLRDVIAEKGEEIGVPLLAAIPVCVALKEAVALQKSIYEYAPRCSAATSYKKLFKTITETMEG